jgi:threonine/homoserine/homoserine lactone efflux protein
MAKNPAAYHCYMKYRFAVCGKFYLSGLTGLLHIMCMCIYNQGEMVSFLIYIGICFAASGSPGPAVLLAIKNGARYGMPKALMGCLGNISAMLTMATLSAAGLGAIILASSTLFTIIKVIGSAYLIYLGVKTWRQSSSPVALEQEEAVHTPSILKVYCEAYLVGISNPKAIAFYIALFPQFIQPDSPVLPQFLLLAVTFAVVSFTCLSIYATAATRIRAHLQKNHFSRWFHRVTGGIFIGFGAGLLTH